MRLMEWIDSSVLASLYLPRHLFMRYEFSVSRPYIEIESPAAIRFVIVSILHEHPEFVCTPSHYQDSRRIVLYWVVYRSPYAGNYNYYIGISSIYIIVIIIIAYFFSGGG